MPVEQENILPLPVTHLAGSASIRLNMKKWIIVSFAAGLLAVSPSALRAQNATNSTPNPGQGATQTPDASQKKALRRQILAILGISPKELKGLAPADRRAKIKAAVETKVAALKQKEAAGTLTAQEQSDLDLLKKFAQHRRAKATSSN
jgi:hypothetical protein